MCILIAEILNLAINDWNGSLSKSNFHQNPVWGDRLTKFCDYWMAFLGSLSHLVLRFADYNLKAWMDCVDHISEIVLWPNHSQVNGSLT